MMRFVTKEEFWDARDAGIGNRIQRKRFSLKTIQDTICLSWLNDARGKTIGDIGGGQSIVLQYLADDNDCTIIDPFEGEGGGPTERPELPNIKIVPVTLGDFSPVLEDETFDVLFSVSVVEHVVTENLDDFFRDCARLTKPGGLGLHLIDAYLGDMPEAHRSTTERVRRYEETFGSYFDFSDREEMIDEVEFTCAYATNPDNMMQLWNKIAPALKEKRKVQQSCSLIMAGTKRAG